MTYWLIKTTGMKQHVVLFILFTWLCALPLTGKAQDSWVVKFNSPLSESSGDFINNSNDEFIGYVAKIIPQTSIRDFYLYKIDKNGDTVLNRKFPHKQDTILSFCNIIQSNCNPEEYLVSGYGNTNFNGNYSIYDFFIKVDSNFNTIWERNYILKPNNISASYEYLPQILKKKDLGYIYGTLYDNAGNNRLVFFEMGENGDSLAYRVYEGDSAGLFLYDLYYNYDSSAYLVNVWDTHPIPLWGETQILTLDLDFNQTKVTYLPRWHSAITSRLLPGGSVVSGGLYKGILLNPYQLIDQICILKHDTSLTLTDSSYFTNPDHEIGKHEGYYNSIDYYYPNSIFVAGTYDYDIGIWVSHPSWIAIAKYDSDLNLLTEKYIGGDAYYALENITATSDGGLLITTTRYDYQTQYQEHDLYVIKLDSLDLLVGNTEHHNKLVKNAMVYPNPARDHLYVKTAVREALFALYDMGGKAVLKQPLATNGTTTKITLPAGTPQGNYLWHITCQNKIIETGKLIILK
ncbi:MAG: hypothetical protein DRJ02_12580 [Bacteroidetes bacterium]|nr:MAG: hypothetical protein DRJ02_12580 [Bacteroidota bacterium]